MAPDIDAPEPMIRQLCLQQSSQVYSLYQSRQEGGQRELFIPGKHIAMLIDSDIKSQEGRIRVFAEGYISMHFSLAINGTLVSTDGDHHELNTSHFTIARHTAEPTVYFSETGSVVSYLMLLFRPDALGAALGFDRETLPEPLQAIFENTTPSSLIQSSILSDSLRQVLLDILQHSNTSYSIPVALRQIYLGAKLQELIYLSACQLSLESARDRGDCIKLRPSQIRRLKQVRNLIQQRIANPPPVEELCQLAACGEKTLTAGFRQLFGTTTYQYGLELRLTEARRMLQSGDYNVSQVAECVGYQQIHSFSRMFSSRYGVSPKTLLENGREKF